MILRFRLGNYRSFRDDVELSLVPTALGRSEAMEVPSGEGGRTAKALSVVGIFGANASGKTNLLRGVEFMAAAVTQSHAHWQPSSGINRDEYRFDESYNSAPSLFELDFVCEGDRFQYGFEVDGSAVRNEWLYTYPRGRRVLLFEREGQAFMYGKTLSGPNKSAERITRNNSLYLSAAATSNHEFLTKIFEWFAGIQVIRTATMPMGLQTTGGRLKGGDNERVSQLLRHADLGIEGIRLEPMVLEEKALTQVRKMIEIIVPTEEQDDNELLDQVMSSLAEQSRFQLLHSGPHGTVPIPYEEESLGTQTWFSLIGPILDALENGTALLVDEIDSSLHPLLIANALTLFQEKTTNTKGAQLIFTAHDTTPLSELAGGIPLNRDQVWLTEKSADGATILTPLSEFRPRKGENIQRGYLQGRYGGVPNPASLDLSLAVLGTGTALDRHRKSRK